MRKVSNWVMGVAMDQVRSMLTDPRSNLPYHLNKVERRGLPARTPEQLALSAEQEQACLVAVRLKFNYFTQRTFEALVPVVLVDNRVDVAESFREGLERAYNLAHSKMRYGYYPKDLTYDMFMLDCGPMNLAPVFSETFGHTVDAPVAFIEIEAKLDYNPFPEFIHDGWAATA